MAVKEKHVLLKKAKKEFKETGEFSIKFEESAVPELTTPSS